MKAAAFLTLGILAHTPRALAQSTTVADADRASRSALLEEQHHALLTSHIDAHVRRENAAELTGYIEAVLALGMGVVGAASIQYDAPLGATWLSTSVASTTITTSSFFSSRGTRIDALTLNTDLVVFGSALAVGIAEEPGDFPRTTSFGVAGAFFVHGLLNAANVFSAPRARHALRRHRERLQRGKPSPRELKRIEADFLQSERPVSHGLLAVPLGLGAAVAVLPAFDDDSNGTEQTISIVGASVLAIGCLFSAITPDLTSSYLANIEASGLELSMTPSRMDLAYRF